MPLSKSINQIQKDVKAYLFQYALTGKRGKYGKTDTAYGMEFLEYVCTGYQ